MNLYITILVGLLFLSCHSQSDRKASKSFVRGAYGNFQPFVKQDIPFKKLGLNAIFTRYSSLDSLLWKKAKNEEVKVFVEFPLLNGKGYVDNHPGAWPVLANGQKATPADWFMGVCLTNPEFKEFRIDQLHQLLQKFQVNGIWLDYVHWHAQFETPDPILPETCFCDRCLREFAQHMEVSIPDGNTEEQSTWIFTYQDSLWRKWRSLQVTHWISDFYQIIKNNDPEILMGVYYCPWLPDEFQQASYRILGIDIRQWVDVCDVLSPMLYHKHMGHKPVRIQQYLTWMNQTLNGNTKVDIWPIIQAHHVDPEEFRQVMKFGMQPPSTGIQMFTVNSVLQDTIKTNITIEMFDSL